ncbi:MAG: Glu/Leu/Phe/Val dehydrogenase [Armatimonadota bacterium]
MQMSADNMHCEADARFDHDSELENVLQNCEPVTRSRALMQRAGERLGLARREIMELVTPQQVTVFRIPCKILGKVVNFAGVLALHNNARGPFKGGIRLAADVTIWETIELSRLMTLKTAACDIEFGGGKTGIRVDMPALYQKFGRGPKRDLDFEKIISLDAVEYYSQNFRDTFSKHIYVPAPDMGTGPDEMAFIYNETLDPASVTGKPEGTPGWLPGRKESTGVGCCYITLRAMEQFLKLNPADATVAIQGFGNVAKPLALGLAAAGCRVTAITDFYGGVSNPRGLNIDNLLEWEAEHTTVAGFPEGEPIDNEGLFRSDVDCLIPAAAGDVINTGDAGEIKAKLIVEAANMPTTLGGMDILTERGIQVVPDILANAGGVIASMLEYSSSLTAIKPTKEDVLGTCRRKIGENFDLAVQQSEELGISVTEAAVNMATERVYKVMKSRRMI